jgi:hypothetical protein
MFINYCIVRATGGTLLTLYATQFFLLHGPLAVISLASL